MNGEELKEKISIAKKAVEDESEPFKTEAFKIILNKLLSTGQSTLNTPSITPRETESTNANGDPVEIFANHIGISKNDLLNVLDFKDDQLSLLRIKGNKISEQYYYCALMILAFWKISMREEFVSNVKLGRPMSKYGIPTANLSANLKKTNYKEFIVTKGKGKSQEYRITTKGIQQAVEIIKELAQ